MKRSIPQFAIACLFALPAHAYVDPGTGSMVIQIIIGGIVASAYMVKTYYDELKRPIAACLGRIPGTRPMENHTRKAPALRTRPQVFRNDG